MSNDIFDNRNSAIERAARSADALSKNSEDALFEELGLRMVAITKFPADSSNFDLTISRDYLPHPPKSALIAVGKRVFSYWNKTLYKFVCEESQESSPEKDRLFKALLGRNEGAASIITGVLVASFGLSPAIAVVVGPLVVKLVLVPANQAVCEVWKERLVTQ